MTEPVVHCYFAYGSNMSQGVFTERVNAIAVGPAALEDHALVFDLPSRRWGGHAANITPRSGATVWGRLWRVHGGDLSVLDEYESAYDRVMVTVQRLSEPAEAVSALTYTVKPERRSDLAGRPVPTYRDHMVDGARQAGLPAPYVAWLERSGS